MAGHYSPKHFLRQVPNPLLKTFFDRRSELQEIEWSEVGEMDVDSIFEAWQDLPEASRNDVERWFRAVAELATPEGLQTLIEEGQFHGVDLTVCLGRLKGVHEKVFWVYLDHERIFFSAGRLDRISVGCRTLLKQNHVKCCRSQTDLIEHLS